MPLPWESGVSASNGFNQTGKSWIPQPEIYAEYARNRQDGVAGSTLEMYKHALKLRKELGLGHGSFDWAPEYVSETSLGYRNGSILVIHNFGEESIPLPSGIVVASSSFKECLSVEANQTVWLQL